MNIFVLDTNVNKCAEYHNNKHVVKMVLETAQLLCGVHHMTKGEKDIENIPYRLSHKNHPCAIWARTCIENYIWLCKLGIALSEEYTVRYGKTHKSQQVIQWCYDNLPNINSNGQMSEFPLAMPEECKKDTAVNSYRNYYMTEKRNIADWKCSKPFWYK